MLGTLYGWLWWIIGALGIGGLVAAVVILGPGSPIVAAGLKAAWGALRWAGRTIASGIDAVRERPRAVIIVGLAAVVFWSWGYVVGHRRATAEHTAYVADATAKKDKAEADAKAKASAAEIARRTAEEAERRRSEAERVAGWAMRGRDAAVGEAERTWQLFAAPHLPSLAPIPRAVDAGPDTSTVTTLPLTALGAAVEAPKLAQGRHAAKPAPKPAPPARRPPDARPVPAYAALPWTARVRQPPRDPSLDDLIRRGLGAEL